MVMMTTMAIRIPTATTISFLSLLFMALSADNLPDSASVGRRPSSKVQKKKKEPATQAPVLLYTV